MSKTTITIEEIKANPYLDLKERISKHSKEKNGHIINNIEALEMICDEP